MHTTRIIAAALSLAVSISTIAPAYARGKSDERACERYRVEHPGFLGPFKVSVYKAAAWSNLDGPHEPSREFACPAASGGESVPAMQIAKVSKSRKH